MKTPKVTDADREASEKIANECAGMINPIEACRIGWRSAILHERAKVDELVRALENVIDDGDAAPVTGGFTLERLRKALKQFSGRSG